MKRSLLLPKYIYSFIVLFALLLATGLSGMGQTPGLIIKPITGGGANVLDPNGDGYASMTASGYVSNDYSLTETELPFVALVRPDPVGDPIIGPTGSFNEIVGVEGSGENAIFTCIDGSNNFLVRFRLDGYAPNSKTYALFIDTDGKFGFTGPNADEDATTDNPGFELEISLHTNFTVSVYNIDNKGSLLLGSYSYDTNCQKSIAMTTNSGNPDYFYDFFVPLGVTGLTSSSPIRTVAVTTMNPNQAIGNNALSDVGGEKTGNNTTQIFEEIIGEQTPTPPGQEVLDRSDCPSITAPVLAGATSVSGTSAEANGTTIRVYVNGVYVNSDFVSGGNWTVTGLSSLLGAQVVTTTAQANGEGESASDCNSTTVGADCVSSPYTLGVVNGKKGVEYSIVALDNTTVTLYNAVGTQVAVDGTSYPNPETFTTAGTYTNGRISNQSGNSLPDGKYYLVANKIGACASPKVWICLGSGFPATANPNITTATTTTVSGTGVSGATLYLFTTGDIQIGTAIVSSGTWSISSLSLDPCQEVYARQIATGNYCISANSALAYADDNDQCVAPIIDGADCISGGTLTSLSGFSVEAAGTVIRVYNASGSTLIGSTTVGAGGNWTLSPVSIAAGQTIYATATNDTNCRDTSPNSTSVTITSRASNAGLAITTNPITENVTSSISGTGTNGYTVTVLLDGVDELGTATVAGGTWTVSITASLLTAGSTVTAIQTTTGYCESLPSAGVVVACQLPSATFTSLTSAQTGFCEQDYGLIVINATQAGVIYTPVLALDNSTAGYSILGNGGQQTIMTYALATNPTLFKIKATKIGSANCSTISTETVSVNMYYKPLNKTLTSSGTSICRGSPVTIIIADYEADVTYELQDASDNSFIASTSVISGADLRLTTGALYDNVTIQVGATKIYALVPPLTCTSVLTTKFSIIVSGPQTNQSVYADTEVLCNTGSTNIKVDTYSDGNTYRIFRASDNTQVGSNFTGNGTTFTVSTGTITVSETYYATVDNGGGCLQVRLPDQVTVLVSHLAEVVDGIINASCFGNSDGVINLSVTGNVLTPTYLWNTGQTTQDISGLAPATYTVTITDGGNCTIISDHTITEPDVLVLTTTTVQNDNGSQSGMITADIAGGTAAYTLSWTGPESGTINIGSLTTYNISNLLVGEYTVTVTDANGCTDNKLATVGDASSLIVNATITDVSCRNGNNGEIDLQVGGGTGSYTYDWDNDGLEAPDNDTQDLSGLIAGSYTVIITDVVSAITSTATFEVHQPAAALAVTGMVTNVTCYGLSTGSIDITVTGGTTNYSYSWTGPASYSNNIADISNLAAGSYTVTVTDARGCTVQETFAVTQPTPISISLVPTDATVFGSTDGAIDATVSGGTPPYNYDWSHIAGTDDDEDVENLTSGNYTLLVTDQNGCTASAVTFINQPINSTSNCAYVLGDDFQTNNYAGRGGSTGSLNWSGNWIPVSDVSNIGLGSVTCPNSSYALQLGSLDGSNVTFLPVITRAADLSIFTTQATLAFDYCMDKLSNETVHLKISFKTNLIFDQIQDISIIANGSGTYSIPVISTYLTSGFGLKFQLTSNGNSKASINIDNLTISSTKTFAATATPTNVTCYGGSDGSIDLGISGTSPGISPYTYVWTTADGSGLVGGDEDQTGLTTGTYNVAITDNGGCGLTLNSIVVSAPASAITANISTTNPSCPGLLDGSISILSPSNGNGTGYQYQFTNSSGTVLQAWSSTNTLAGLGDVANYKAYIRNAGGGGTCETLLSSTISLTGTDNINPTIACPANYTRTANAASCKASVNVAGPTILTDNCASSITLNNNLTWAASVATILSGSGNVGTQTFNTGLTTIRYMVDDGNGNSSFCEFTVTVNSDVNVTGLSVTASDICAGNNGSVQLFGNLIDGAYSVNYTLSGANSGTSTASITIAGGTGDGSFAIPFASLPVTGTTTVTVNSITSLTTSCAATVNPSDGFIVKALPNAPTGSATQAFCSGSSPVVNNLSITTDPSAIVHWYDAATAGSSLAGTTALVNNTTYYASQEVNGCESAARFAVTATVYSSPTNAVLSGTSTICIGSSANMAVTITGGTSPFAVVYNDGTSNFTVNNYISASNISVTPVTTSTYSLVSVTDAQGCISASITGTPIITVTPTVGAPSTPTPSGSAICQGSANTTYTTSATNATSYTWSVTGSGNNISGSGTTGTVTWAAGFTGNATVSVTATGCNGPSASAYTTVTVNPETPATPGAITGSASQCPGLTSQTYSIDAVINATTYTWGVPSGWSITSGQTTSSITVTTGATGENGNITVTAGNNCGTSSARTLGVTVSPAAPAIPGAITGTTPQCPALTGQAYSIAAVANATTYTWIVPTGWTITSGTGATSITVTTGSSGQNGNITVAASNSCGTSAANTLAVTVSSSSSGGTVASDQTICSGASPNDLILSGNTGLVEKWQRSSDVAFTIPVDISETSTTLSGATIGNLASNTYFRAVIVNGTCDVVYSSAVLVTVNTPSVSSVSIAAFPSGAICSGTSVTFTATPVNGGTPTYEWKLNGSTVGTNSATYTSSTLADTDKVKVVMTSSLTCASGSPATSNEVTMFIQNINAIVSDETSGSDCPDFLAPFNADSEAYNAGSTLVVFRVTRVNSSSAWDFDYTLTGGAVGTGSPQAASGNKSIVAGDSFFDMQFYITNTPGLPQTIVFTVTNIKDSNCTNNGINKIVNHVISAMPAIGSFE